MADVPADWDTSAPHGHTGMLRWDPTTAMAVVVIGAVAFLTFLHLAFRGSVMVAA